MKKIFFTFFCLFFLCNVSSIYSQYTNVINSNKPGFSESPYSVGTGIYQFESNVFFRNTSIVPTFTRPQSLGLDLLFRTSFFLEKLEINAQISYQRDKVAFKNIFTSSYFDSGFSKLTIGAKYLLFQKEYDDKSKEIRSFKKRFAFDKKRFIPSVAIYLGLNTGVVDTYYKNGGVSPKVGVLLQNNLTSDLNIITNFFYDYIGSDFSEMSYIITATQNFSDRWSAFLENQGQFQKNQTNSNLGLGLAYLFNKNLQINASSRLVFEGNAQGFYMSLGASYRIDKHQDSYIDLDEKENNLKDTPISKYNKKQGGFFNRIFSVFKKKDKVKAKRKRPKRTRKKATSKKKKGGFFGLFKKKNKKKKEKKKEDN